MSLSDPLVICGVVLVTAMLIVYMRTSSSGASPSQIRTAIERGLRQEQTQQYLEASLELESALKMIAESPKTDLSQEVTCLVHLGNCYERMGQPDKASEVFKRALRNWEQQLRQNKLQPIDIDFAMTNLDFGRGTLDVAEFYVDNIIMRRERNYPKGHPDLDNSYKIGANLLRKSGYKKEAELLEQRGREGSP